MARHLPCKNCGHAQTAGQPQVVGNPSGFPIYYKCSACKHAYELSATAFSKLPTLSPQDLEQLGFLTPK